MTCDLHITKNSTHLQLLKQERNSFHSICSLPVEILACILHHHQWTPPRKEDAARQSSFNFKWISVMLVCQHFRSVAITAPELWNTICAKRGSESDLGAARMALQASRAGAIPLIILGTREGEQRPLVNMHTARLEVDDECKLVRNPPYPPGYASIDSLDNKYSTGLAGLSNLPTLVNPDLNGVALLHWKLRDLTRTSCETTSILPTSVPAIASPLDFEALPILAEYDERINELSAQLVTLKQERNRLALFCRLPIPALVCIFIKKV
jgi:hypothetical protein